MNRKTAKLRIAIFMGILVLPGILWGIFKISGISTKFEVSLEENRDKYTMPDNMSLADIPGAVEQYYNDRLPFRSLIIKAGNKINTVLEKKYMEDIEPVFIAWIGKGQNNGDDDNNGNDNDTFIEEITETVNDDIEAATVHEHQYEITEKVDSDYENYGYEVRKCITCGEEKRLIQEKLVDTSLFPMKTAGGSTIYGRYNWFFYINTVSDYQGDNIISDEDYPYHIEYMLRLKELCDKLGKELYFIILPNKNSVYGEYMPTVTHVAERRRVQLLEDYINNNTDLNFIYPIDEMLAAKPYHQLYYKYDTHWNSYGALIGVNALYKAMGMETFTFDDCIITPVEKYTGDLIVLGGIDNSGFATDVEVELTYKEKTEYYEVDLLDNRYITTDLDAGNGKSIVMIGDSFRFGFRKFLAKDFSHVLLFDRQLKNNADAEEEIRNSDVIVIELVERNEICLPEDTIYIYNILAGQ